MNSPRRFPPPCPIEEQDACFTLRDHSGQALAFILKMSGASALVCESMHHVKWDCFVWLTNLDCGKASPLLRSSLDLERMPAAP